MMKQYYLLLTLLAFVLNINAYDFTVKNVDGKSIYYNYINNGTEVEVTYEGYYKTWNSSKLKYDYWYGGYRIYLPDDVLVIPESVTYNERTFPVTRIGRSAFHDSTIHYISLPGSIKSIDSYSFQDSFIEEIIIPNGVTDIKYSVFSGCKYLRKVSFPNGLQIISSHSFDACKSLKDVVIPESVTVLEGFTNCTGLTSITIPRNVTSVYFYGCDNLMKIYSYIENPKEISSVAFTKNSFYSGTLYVPKGKVEKYKSASGWSSFTYIEEMADSEGNKCATPSLTYSNKELIYTCDTNGATIHETIKCTDVATTTFKYTHKLNAVYEISAYATADGYSQSETINAKLIWTNGSFETSNVSEFVAEARGILIQKNNDFLTISGLDNNEQVCIYDLSGKQLGIGKSVNGTATFGIKMASKIVVVKVGNESIKVQL